MCVWEIHHPFSNTFQPCELLSLLIGFPHYYFVWNSNSPPPFVYILRLIPEHISQPLSVFQQHNKDRTGTEEEGGKIIKPFSFPLHPIRIWIVLKGRLILELRLGFWFLRWKENQDHQRQAKKGWRGRRKKKGKKRNATCFPDCVLIDAEGVLIKRLRSIQDNQLPFRGMMQKCRKVRNFKKDVDSWKADC